MGHCCVQWIGHLPIINIADVDLVTTFRIKSGVSRTSESRVKLPNSPFETAQSVSQSAKDNLSILQRTRGSAAGLGLVMQAYLTEHASLNDYVQRLMNFDTWTTFGTIALTT